MSNVTSGGPPAYGVHENDEVYTAADAAAAEASAAAASSLERSETGQSSALAVPSPLTEPLSITMDQELIYPTLPPSTAMFHIPHSLSSPRESVMLQVSVPERLRRNGTILPTDDLDLYEVYHLPLNIPEVLEIKGLRRRCYGRGTAMMRRTSLFNQSSWEISFQKAPVITIKNGIWKDADGKLLAREEKHGKETKENNYKIQRTMVLEPGLDQPMVGLLCACWTGKVWREVRRASTKEHIAAVRKEVLKTGMVRKNVTSSFY